MMKDFIMLNSGACFAQARVKDQDYQEDFMFVDIYDFPKVDLRPYKCLVINSFIDQEFLYEHRHLIREFLDDRKVLIFTGNLFKNWLPGGSNFVPKQINSFQDYVVSVHQSHPIFEGVLEDDMTYNKGVSGFFARGHHPVPEGAEVLLTLPGGEPINYIDRNSTKGTIFAHVGNDLFGKMNGSPKTTDRIGPQLMQWARDEYTRLQEGCVQL